MFQKILVAIDNSAISEQVFDTALSLAKAMGATLILLHFLSAEEEDTSAIPPGISLSYYYSEMSEHIMVCAIHQWEALEKQGLELLRSRSVHETAEGVNTQFIQNCENPDQTIREVARTWSADLIVMGLRGHSDANRLLMVNISNYLLNNAPCSVFVVQPQSSINPNFIQ